MRRSGRSQSLNSRTMLASARASSETRSKGADLMPLTLEVKPAEQKSPPPTQRRPSSGRRFRRKALLRRCAALFGLVSSIAAIFALWIVYVDTIPEILPPNSDRFAPFSSPFLVMNDSSIFAMQDTHWLCAFRLEHKNGGIVAFDVSDVIRGPVTTIAPKGTAEYQCSIGLPGDIVKSLTATVGVDFRTLWWARSKIITFTWLADVMQPHWTEGK